MFRPILITCEHARSHIPKPFQQIFAGKKRLLASHRAYDIGASGFASELANVLGCFCLQGEISRLLIDLNRRLSQRSRHAPEVWNNLSAKERAALIEKYYQPHYRAFEKAMRSALRQSRSQPVIHLGIHSFTPVWNSMERSVDIGFLYDPARPLERALANRWAGQLAGEAAGFVVKKNSPYSGKKSGLVGQMREKFSADRYVGIEIELNQKFFLRSKEKARWSKLQNIFLKLLKEDLNGSLQFVSGLAEDIRE